MPTSSLPPTIPCAATRPVPARLFGAVLAVAASACLAQTPSAAAPQNVLSFTASATAAAANDLLSIEFSTTRESADAAQVQLQLKQALDAALAEARKVAKPGQVDVRTGGFSLSPRYGNKGTMNGWQGSAQLVVEGRDMATISQLAGRIQTLTVAGVRQGLSREAREKLEAETTAQAIALFRQRAQAQAAQFGFAGYTLRDVQVGTDGQGPQPPVVAFKARMASAAADQALPMEAGKASVTATVSGSVQLTR